jgi:hypothetical protein
MYIYVHLFVISALIDGQCYYWLLAVVCLLSVSAVDCQSNQATCFFLLMGVVCQFLGVSCRLLVLANFDCWCPALLYSNATIGLYLSAHAFEA